MKGRRHSPEQIVRKLREADRLLAEGTDVDAVCRHLEVSVQTYERWRAQYRAKRDVDGAGMRNWLLFGEPLLSDTPTGKRAEMRMRLAFAAETYAQAIVDAKNGDDTAGKNDALRMLHALMNSHADAIASVDEDSIAAHRRGEELFREAVLRAGGTVE